MTGAAPRITLVGMSGAGKSHWSRRLEAEGFRRFGCDDLIEARLADLLKDADGDPLEMGRWLGFPYEAGYGERQRRYLDMEIAVLEGILRLLETPGRVPGPVVVDTTGSVIYTGERLLERLASRTRVVHLDTPPGERDRMLRNYLGNPRPVIWGDAFRPQPGESGPDAVARCYPAFLEAREDRYRRLAHAAIPARQRNDPELDVAAFLSLSAG